IEPVAQFVQGAQIKALTELAQHGLRNDQFTHGVDERINLVDAHAYGTRIDVGESTTLVASQTRRSTGVLVTCSVALAERLLVCGERLYDHSLVAGGCCRTVWHSGLE